MTQNITGDSAFAPLLSKDEINACPIEHWNGPISVVRSREDLAAATARLVECTLLGFDTETRPAYNKGESYPPSLLQLAADDEVFIFQLKHLGLTEPLRKILADAAIIKAGVGLAYDIRELRKLADFKAAGFVDLAGLAKKAGLRNRGLRGLAAAILGFRISKKARTSNWARDMLTRQQIQYAATDAWVGRRLYTALEKAVVRESL